MGLARKRPNNGSVIVLLKSKKGRLDKTSIAKQKLYCVAEKATAKEEVAW